MLTNIILIIGVIILWLIFREIAGLRRKLDRQDPSDDALWKINLHLESIGGWCKVEGAKEARYKYDKSGAIKELILNFVGKPSIIQERDNSPEASPEITTRIFEGYQSDYYDSGNIKQKVLYLKGHPVMIVKFDEDGNEVYRRDCRGSSTFIDKLSDIQ